MLAYKPIKTIKFSRCPIPGRHYGEYWEKLFHQSIIGAMKGDKKDLLLVSVEYQWSNSMTMDEWHLDTFHDMSMVEIEMFLKGISGNRQVYGMLLEFELPTSDHPASITTFRTYNPNKAKYYENSIGEDFRLALGDTFTLKGLDRDDLLFLYNLPANKEARDDKHGFSKIRR